MQFSGEKKLMEHSLVCVVCMYTIYKEKNAYVIFFNKTLSVGGGGLMLLLM